MSGSEDPVTRYEKAERIYKETKFDFEFKYSALNLDNLPEDYE